MRVTQPAVLVGPYDWDEKLIPASEFKERGKEVWQKLGGAGLAGLIVYGNKMDNAALAYLTNFTPKIQDGYALVAPDGSVRLHSAGSPHMMVNAQRLTWVDAVKPIRDIGKHIGEWAEGLGQGPLGLWATPTMGGDQLNGIANANPARPIKDVSATLDPLLLAKTGVAGRVMRDASGILAKGTTTFRQAFKNGATAREAAVAAEKAAADANASDIRVLVSLSPGGTPTAIDYPQGDKLDPVLAYIAVRYGGYWAEGALTLSSSPSDALKRSEAALQAMLAKARAGATIADLAAAARDKLGGLTIHPAAKKAASGVGLSLAETETTPGGVTRLDEGRIYTLRAGASSSKSDNALLSAMIEPKANGAEILWSSLG
jgi:Xaa-Pro aminopeptidase